MSTELSLISTLILKAALTKSNKPLQLNNKQAVANLAPEGIFQCIVMPMFCNGITPDVVTSSHLDLESSSRVTPPIKILFLPHSLN